MVQTSEATSIYSFTIIFLSYNLIIISTLNAETKIYNQNKTIAEKRNAINIPFILIWSE